MPLRANMTAAQMQDYLIDDLRRSLVNDVKPIVKARSLEGGYFAVPRLVLSYVDYLGALYYGYHGLTSHGRRIFALQSYAKRFLKDVFGLIDVNYQNHGELVWEIYRNGTIHLYEPMRLENGGNVIGWMVYKGARRKLLPISRNPQWVVHLIPIRLGGGVWAQPLSITCLYADLVRAVERYSDLIINNATLQDNFRTAANALRIPEHTRLAWW